MLISDFLASPARRNTQASGRPVWTAFFTLTAAIGTPSLLQDNHEAAHAQRQAAAWM